MSRRTDMLASTIRRELMEMIMRDLNDPRLSGLPSITRVKVSDDLGVADVYVTAMGTPGHLTAVVNALRHSAGLMRTKLTKSLSIRQAPYLKFHADDRYHKELEILGLLEQVRQEDRSRAAADAAPPEPDHAPDASSE
jgi:ribosome-binding factor A